MEQNETNRADILDIIRHIQQKSGDHVRKHLPQHSSVKFFCDLLCHYNVFLGCDICIQNNGSTHKCKLNTITHVCTKDRIVLFAKNTTDNGDLLRKRPLGYNPLETDHICEHVTLKETCLEKQLCPYPHTDGERHLWKKDYYDTVSIASLVRDLRESSLLFSVVVEYLSREFCGTFKVICATCYNKYQQISTKVRHCPWCRWKAHYWEKNKKLVFEIEVDNRLIDFDDVEMRDKDEEELVNWVRLLLSDISTCIDDIADEAARLRQLEAAWLRQLRRSADEAARPRQLRRSEVTCTFRKAKGRKGKHEPCHSESDDSDGEKNDFHLAKTNEEIFDEDATDVLNNAAFDEDTGDSQDINAAGPRIKGDYYKTLTEEQTQNDSEVIYGCGTIKLHGAFAGSCMIVGGELNGCEVELRGRVNCGPAFDGDEVQVKVYKSHKEVQSKTENSEVKNSKSGKSSQLSGTVVNVIKRNVHRTARTFLCTVGRHDGHLMTPLCGTLPKFHIVDTCLSKRYGSVKKNNYVAVYDSGLKLRKTVKLDPRMRREMLFVVKYLKWENKHKYPLGYVCRILHTSRTEEESQKILNLMYELPCNNDTEPKNTKEFEKQDRGGESERREVCTLLTTVSIDPPSTKVIDDALSLEKSNGNFIVWTHVADVTHYIQKDDVYDVKAQKRMLSSYSSSVHMLPKELVEDKCSLLENQDRRAMSIRFEISAYGEVLSTTGPSPSWIWNDKQLTYEDVQKVIDGDEDGDKTIKLDIKQMLRTLHILATALRKKRLRDSIHYYEYSRQHYFNRKCIDDPFDEKQNHDAKWLVEEFMILANEHVGKMLKLKFAHCTPFLVQNTPKDALLRSWVENHCGIIPFSFYLSQFEEYLGVGHHPAVEHHPAVTQLFMLQDCWDTLSATVDQDDVAVNEGAIRKVKMIIGSEKLHPLHGIALSSWFNIQEPSHYSCDVSDGNRNTRHFSLQTCVYVHFASPLRRYVDIIAHRLLKANPDQPPPYTQDEVVALCKKMNEQKCSQRKYDDSCELQKMTGMLKTLFFLPCYVDSYDDISIYLVSPYFQTDSPLTYRLKFSEMMLHKIPETSSNSGKVTLTWSKRYYDTRISGTTNARTDSVTDYVLDSGMFGMPVSPPLWLEMHDAVKGQRENLLSRVSKAMRKNNAFQQLQQVHNTVQDVTSEMAENKPLVRHHVKFSRDIERGIVLSVQFGAEAVKGFLQPVIKLVNLTHDKDICVEHQRDPVSAFALVAYRKAKDTYNNIEEYQYIWKAILAMEAATNAVQNESIVCSHVPVKFIKRNGNIYGTLKLSKNFCDQRYITMYRDPEKETQLTQQEETHDYMCIRYSMEKTTSSSRSVWVAHAAVVSCSSKKRVIELTVKCNCIESEAPSELFASDAVECTMELLQRALPDK